MEIFNGRPCFYQWDLNQKLYISDTTHNYVHFANEGDENALVVQVYEKDGRRMVNVPNILLQSGKKILAFTCLSADAEFHTHEYSKFKVKTRPKPDDYVYTETEVLNYNAIIDKLNNLELGTDFIKKDEIGNGLKVTEDGRLCVDIAEDIEPDNTLPVSSSLVHMQIGNINELLSTI